MSFQSVMIQSALLTGLNQPLEPFNPRPTTGFLTPVPVLDTLNLTYDDLGVAAYNYRDQELLYRDIVVASYAAALSLQISTVWNCESIPVTLPVIPAFRFDYHLADLPGGASPASPADVSHVENSSVPSDAILADQQLYSRDALLVETLARLEFVFPPEYRSTQPIDYNIVSGNAWSRAKASTDFNDISVSSPYARSTFFNPDRYLASRDNSLANSTAQLNQFLINIFEGADRLLLRVNSTSTTYNPPLPPAPPSPS